jgi:hypothetical protein
MVNVDECKIHVQEIEFLGHTIRRWCGGHANHVYASSGHLLTASADPLHVDAQLELTYLCSNVLISKFGQSL